MSALCELVRLPEVKVALVYTENRPVLAALRRHGITVLRISPRNIAIRVADFEKLLASSAETSQGRADDLV